MSYYNIEERKWQIQGFLFIGKLEKYEPQCIWSWTMQEKTNSLRLMKIFSLDRTDGNT